MEQPKKAAFEFKDFRIPEFSYNERSSENETLKLHFDPKGRYLESKGEFRVEIAFSGYENQNEADVEICHLKCIGLFKFQDNLSIDEIPEYFYSNSMAIMYPYLRSFLGSITMQANAKMIMLGLLNLTPLAATLRENTKVVED